MIPAPKGRYPPAEHYRLHNEYQIVSDTPRPIKRALALILLQSFLCTRCIREPSTRVFASPRSRGRETSKSLPAQRRMMKLVAEVEGVFRELR